VGPGAVDVSQEDKQEANHCCWMLTLLAQCLGYCDVVLCCVCVFVYHVFDLIMLLPFLRLIS
jgi:hypothetical protein